MSNCHNLFQQFNGNLNISSGKKSKLMTSRDSLRDKIRKYFKENHPEYKPKFRGQGSYSLGTMIRTKEDTCDLDNGVYFFPKPKETGTTIQKWVKDAVNNATSEPAQHRSRCVRVVYKGDYHIDLPVYYKVSESNDSENPHLAVKDADWSLSDPKEFGEWFRNQKDEKGQLVRVVRYLKAWSDHKRNKLPNGLTISVLAANHLKNNDRDDVCLRDTLEAIRSQLRIAWCCIMPTTPNDDLLANFKGSQDYFFECIDSFIEDANKAIDDENNQLKASKLWQKHLGSYFPDGEDKDVDKQEKELNRIASSVLGGSALLNKNGIIQESEGVRHKPHKNYGGS